MKKLISILLLSGSLVLSGCGDSSSDYTQVSGQQGNPGPVVPTPTPTPTATAGYFVDATNGNDATAAAAANPTSDTPFATIQAAVTDAPNVPVDKALEPIEARGLTIHAKGTPGLR